MKNINYKIILLIIACFIPLLMIGLAVKKRHLIKIGFHDGDSAMAGWLSQKFQRINDDKNFRQVLNTIPIHNNSTSSIDELSSLNVSLDDFFMAFYRGDFESYRRFRMPTGRGHYDPALLKWLVHDISVSGQIPATTNLEQGDMIFKDYWNKVGANKFSEFFQGLCIEKSYLTITDSDEFPPHYDMVVGASSFKPTFVSDPQPEEIKKEFGKIHIAILTSLVKNADGVAYPIVCSWYYSPKDKIWVIGFLGNTYLGSSPQKTHLIF